MSRRTLFAGREEEQLPGGLCFGKGWQPGRDSFADITTGEFATTQIDGGEACALALHELARLGPRECLVPEGDSSLFSDSDIRKL